jgi:hypothetical protein
MKKNRDENIGGTKMPIFFPPIYFFANILNFTVLVVFYMGLKVTSGYNDSRYFLKFTQCSEFPSQRKAEPSIKK